MSRNARPRPVDHPAADLFTVDPPAADQHSPDPVGPGRRTDRFRHARPSRLRAWAAAWAPAVLGSSATLVVGVIVINVAVGPSGTAAADPASPSIARQATRTTGAASRGNERPVPSAPAPAPASSLPDPSPPPAPVPPAAPVPARSPAARPPAHQPLVAGLNQVQTDNAATIVNVGRHLGLPERALVVAIATALQESDLRNLANQNVPASLALPHQDAERDADSVGLFQQRPSKGWGTVAELMDPATSAGLFYAKLTRVRNWENLSVGAAAQAVQISAFPNAYDKHVALAQRIVAAL